MTDSAWYTLPVNSRILLLPLTPDQVAQLSATRAIAPADPPVNLPARLGRLLAGLGQDVPVGAAEPCAVHRAPGVAAPSSTVPTRTDRLDAGRD